MTYSIDPQAVVKGQGSVKQPGANNCCGEPAPMSQPMAIESGDDRVRNAPHPEERSAIIAS